MKCMRVQCDVSLCVSEARNIDDAQLEKKQPHTDHDRAEADK